MLFGMPAISAFLAHFYAVVRHAGGLHWFRGGGLHSVAQARSQFFADLSHELQTPIAIIKSNLEILSGRRGGDRKAALATMGATTDRIARMVDGFLAAARLDFPDEELHKEEFMLADLLAEVRDDCTALAGDKGVNFFQECGSAASITADREKIREVILNLISNALAHTERGGEIQLSGRMVANGATENVEIAVADTGSGIAPEELPRIFERFYRINGDVATGTGLGLHICQKIVVAHGGHIKVESELGKGSRFAIFLPLRND
jgi:signal transduction histidine kinase